MFLIFIQYMMCLYKRVLIIIIVVCISMSKQKEPYTLEPRMINGKQFLVPIFNLYDCEKYMLPKLDNAPVHHTFYNPTDLEEVYKEMNIDPEELNHNLNKQGNMDKIMHKKSSQMREQSKSNSESIDIKDSSTLQMLDVLNISKRPRPSLRETGYTHFIHIPLWDALKDLYNNQIVPRIQEEDRDLLMPLSSMHMTVLVFRLRKLEDLPLWSQVIKSAKKTKISIKGVNIFPIKKNFAKVLFLNIKGVEDLIDRVVSKAIELNLINQSELSHIKFDKVSSTYKAEAHVSLLRTKGEDLYDFTEYLKTLGKINLPKATISQIRISVIGSHDGSDYYNEEILQL